MHAPFCEISVHEKTDVGYVSKMQNRFMSDYVDNKAWDS